MKVIRVPTSSSSSSKSDLSGIFFVFSGAEIQPLSQWNLGDLFPKFEKKSQSQNKKISIIQSINQFYIESIPHF